MTARTLRTFQINLRLSIDEANALARLARCECRDLRGQAYYIVRKVLIDMGELPADTAPRDAERGPVKGGGLASPN